MKKSTVKIIKSINNNAAIALDGSGNEMVVLGNGIGFPKTPYDIKDLKKIERSFYDVDSKFVKMITEIPKEILFASSDIVEQAEMNLEHNLNRNLTFTLADHLHFSIKRFEMGVDFNHPLEYDIKHLYPLEYEIGLLSLDILEDYTNIRLPIGEAVNIALHISNAESKNRKQENAFEILRIISDIDEIIESSLSIKIQKDNYSYFRFVTHIRYLISRLCNGEQINSNNEDIFKSVINQSPKLYTTAQKVADYLENKFKLNCNQNEILYIMLYIGRMVEKNKLL